MQPAPQTLATRGSLQLMVPIDQGIITGIVFHRYDGSDAISLTPVGHQSNAGFLTRMWNGVFGDDGGGLGYNVDSGSTQGVDVGAPAGTAVYAPANGQVVSITPYVLNGDATRFGQEIAISPSSDPSFVVKIAPIAARGRPARQADAAGGPAGHRRPHEARRRRRRDRSQPAGAVPLRLGRGERREHPRRAGHRSGDAVVTPEGH